MRGELRLDGKVALVTGGARRVGLAIAMEMGRAGARVVLHYHGTPDAEAQAAAAEVRAAGSPEVTLARADLSHASSCDALIERSPPLDVLINSAAVFVKKPFLELEEADWDAMLALNLAGPRRLARGFAKGLIARGGEGVIINVLDVAAVHAWRGYAHYCVSKAALLMLTRVLALELAPAIRTMGVAPGPVAFPESLTEADRMRILRTVPLGHAGAPEDVGETVRFLCAGPPYLNGVVVPIDGGRSAGNVGTF